MKNGKLHQGTWKDEKRETLPRHMGRWRTGNFTKAHGKMKNWNTVKQRRRESNRTDDVHKQRTCQCVSSLRRPRSCFWWSTWWRTATNAATGACYHSNTKVSVQKYTLTIFTFTRIHLSVTLHKEFFIHYFVRNLMIKSPSVLVLP